MEEETPWNRLCVDLIGPYKMQIKGKDPLILKPVTMIDSITRWFEVTQYRNKKMRTIAYLVETTWMVRYPWPVEITYDRRGKFLSHEFKNILIEIEYGIKTKPANPCNPQVNAIIERTHQLLGNFVLTYNLQETYVDGADPCMVILVAAAFALHSMYHTTKGKRPGELFFGRDVILAINHIAD